MTEPDGRFAGLTILLVEDELLVALALEDALLGLGCAVVGPATRPAAALDLVRAERLDGAILNVNLGGETVLPVAEALADRSIPFLFCTGYRDVPAALGRFRGIPILAKPFDAAGLAEVMARVFPPRRGAGPAPG